MNAELVDRTGETQCWMLVGSGKDQATGERQDGWMKISWMLEGDGADTDLRPRETATRTKKVTEERVVAGAKKGPWDKKQLARKKK